MKWHKKEVIGPAIGYGIPPHEDLLAMLGNCLEHQLRAAVRSALDDICPFLGSTNRCRILFAMFACDLAGSSLKQTAPVCQSHCYLSISRVSALLPPLCHYAEPNKWEIVYIYIHYMYIIIWYGMSWAVWVLRFWLIWGELGNLRFCPELLCRWDAALTAEVATAQQSIIRYLSMISQFYL